MFNNRGDDAIPPPPSKARKGFLGAEFMSSYLNIYGVSKKTKEKELIVSYSRSNDIYQAIDEEINVVTMYECADDKEPRYSELCSSRVRLAIDDIEEMISNSEKRLAEYEKHANGNLEIIDEIIQLKDFIKTEYATASKMELLYDICEDTEQGFNGFEKILCNIT